MDNRALEDVGSIRAMLFDLGGVVFGFDLKRAFRVWADLVCRDPVELERRFAFDEPCERHERGELDAAGYFAALRQNLDLHLSNDEIVAGWNDIYLGPVPGISALLFAASQHFPLYAFTNSNPTHQSVWAGRFANELSIFRSIFVSSDLGLRKPDPEAFKVVAGRTGLQISELLFFDDTPENVDGARRVGMQAVLVESSADVREALLRLGIEVEASDEVDP
jgi:putative hydrolase of the HAD superfamily